MFTATLTGPNVAASNGRGIWAHRSGILSAIACDGSQAVGFAEGTTFYGYQQPLVNSTGQVVFDGLVSEASTAGIWLEDAGSVELLVRSGVQAPGLADDGIEFAMLRRLGINNVGQLLFAADLAGPGVTADSAESLWVCDRSGRFSLIARQGDLLETSPGILHRITDVSFSSNTEQGLTINDSGQVAFAAGFANYKYGVFVATVPEPAMVGPLVLLLFLRSGRVRRGWG